MTTVKKLASLFWVILLVSVTSTSVFAAEYSESKHSADIISAENTTEEISLYSFTKITSSRVLGPYEHRLYTFYNPTGRNVKLYAIGSNVNDSNGGGAVTIGSNFYNYNNYSESPHTLYLPAGNITYEVRSYSGDTTTYSVLIGY